MPLSGNSQLLVILPQNTFQTGVVLSCEHLQSATMCVRNRTIHKACLEWSLKDNLHHVEFEQQTKKGKNRNAEYIAEELRQFCFSPSLRKCLKLDFVASSPNLTGGAARYIHDVRIQPLNVIWEKIILYFSRDKKEKTCSLWIGR